MEQFKEKTLSHYQGKLSKPLGKQSTQSTQCQKYLCIILKKNTHKHLQNPPKKMTYFTVQHKLQCKHFEKEIMGCKKLIDWPLKKYFPAIKKNRIMYLSTLIKLIHPKIEYDCCISLLISFLAWLIIYIILDLHHHKDLTHCFLESHLINAGKEASGDQDFVDCLIQNFLYAKSKFLANSYLFV